MNSVTTEKYSLTASEYTSLIARRWLSAWWWAFALPLAASAIAAFSDVRFIYVSLIIVFIIWPMALSVVWFRYALTDEAIRAIRQCIATVDDDKFIFEYPAKINPEDGSITMKALPSISIKLTDIKTIEQDGKFMVIMTKPGQCTHDTIIMPARALPDEIWQAVFEKISD